MTSLFLPDSLGIGTAIGLTVLSYFTSAFTAAFGIGGGVALITVLAQVLPPAVVIPVHGVVQTGSNLGRTWTFRAHVRWSIVRWFALGAVLGVASGSVVLVRLPARALLIALAAFILWSLWAPKWKASAIGERGFIGVGWLATFLGLFLGATGPIVGAFWNQATLGRHGQVATHAAVMSLVHGFKCIAFGFLGFVFGEWLGLIVAMVASGYLGTLTGRRILGRLPERAFTAGFKWTLTLLALRLLYDGVAGSR